MRKYAGLHGGGLSCRDGVLDQKGRMTDDMADEFMMARWAKFFDT